MSDTDTQPTSATPATETTASAPRKHPGTTFDIVEEGPEGADGKATWTNRGTAFVRESKAGGVLWLKLPGVGPEGKLTLALFPRKRRG
jgi:hypothetical protein